jgi:hypothetical protein
MRVIVSENNIQYKTTVGFYEGQGDDSWPQEQQNNQGRMKRIPWKNRKCRLSEAQHESTTTASKNNFHYYVATMGCYKGQTLPMGPGIPRAAEQSREDEQNSSYESEVPIPQDPSTSKYQSEVPIPQDPSTSKYQSEVPIPQDQSTSKYESEVPIPQDPSTSRNESEVPIPQDQSTSKYQSEVPIPQDQSTAEAMLPAALRRVQRSHGVNVPYPHKHHDTMYDNSSESFAPRSPRYYLR